MPKAKPLAVAWLRKLDIVFAVCLNVFAVTFILSCLILFVLPTKRPSRSAPPSIVYPAYFITGTSALSFLVVVACLIARFFIIYFFFVRFSLATLLLNILCVGLIMSLFFAKGNEYIGLGVVCAATWLLFVYLKVCNCDPSGGNPRWLEHAERKNASPPDPLPQESADTDARK